MFQPSSSRDPLLARGGDSDSDGGESVEKHAYDHDFSVGESVYFTDVDEDESLTHFSESTVIEGVDANVLKLLGEDQRFRFVEFSPDWSLVVTVTSGGTFSIWDAKSEWVLVGSKCLHHGGRTLKCIAFDPYDEETVLLCFDSGEIFRANLRGPATSDVPGSSQEQGMIHVELVHWCEGRTSSRFDHFTFSSDRRIMVYYNLDGEFAAVQFQEQGELKKITLSKEFKLKQEPVICVTGQSILITAMLQSSEDHEPGDEQMRTLVWSKVDFEHTENENKPGVIRGKGYLSNDGKYVLVSVLAIEHESRCCHITVHLIEDVKSNANMKVIPIATKSLRFTSNHPHLECLDWTQFRFLHADNGNIKPLIAIHQTNYVASRLLFWDISSDAIVYEINLTLIKEARKYSDIKYCWSSDYKYIGVCSIEARIMGLVCARSGIFVWTAIVPQISKEDAEFCTLSFNPLETRFMIYLGMVIYLLEPPCLSKKPQKHPMHDNLLLSQDSRKYSDFEILELAKEWPKQVLFNVVYEGQSAKLKYKHFLLDVAISLTSESLAMICKKRKAGCFLAILNYSKTLSWESLWLVIMTRWKQGFLPNRTSPLVKEIRGSRSRKGISVFYYHNEETNNEHVVLLSSKGGVKLLDLDSKLNQLSDWKKISKYSCLSWTQTKDRRRVISLANKRVLIVDLNKKMIIETIEYSFGLSQWWESFLDRIKFFAYSQYDTFTSQESNEEPKLFLQDRLRGLFDVSDDGATILIGWDNNRNRSLVITPDKTEEQFRTEWDEAHESLYQSSMLTRNGKWLGFIDHEQVRDGNIVLCVVNTTSNHQQRIWLGSNELQAKQPLNSQSFVTSFFLQLDEAKEKLKILGLEEIGHRSKLKRFSICHQSLLEDMTQPINLDRYGASNQPFVFNMNVVKINNFQRVLVEEGESKMEEMARYALHNKVKISDVYRFYQDNEHDHKTFLANVLEKQEATLVQLCLRFIEDGLFTFHSASTMVKDSFFEMLFSYNELILPILKRNSLTLFKADIKVPAQIFQSQSAISYVAFTSDTLLEPNEHFVQMASKNLHNSNISKRLGWTKDHKEGRKVLSSVSFHYIANACKVGLNGIVRKLLMLEVDSSIFKTELIRATVSWKWEKLWRRRCLWQLYLYIIFLIFFTSYVVGIGMSGNNLIQDKKVGQGISFLLLGSSILTVVFLIDECMQLKTYIKDGKELFGAYMWGFKHYFIDSQWNLFELTSYFLVLVLIPIFHCIYIFEHGSKKTLFAMVAIESLIAWFKLWYYAQPFERTGALVLLISNVIHDCIPFLLLSLIVLVGFSVALYILFQCVSNFPTISSLEEDEANLIHESFGSLWRSMSTLFYAMVGTFEVEVYYNHQSLPWLTTLIFILYMALEMIVMLNMLIAIMGDTFDRVKNEEDVQIILGRARFIDAYEASLSARQIREVEKQIGRYLYVLTPKEGEHVAKSTNWKGRINAIEENVKKSIIDNNEKTENSMKQHFEQNRRLLQEHSEEHWKKEEEHWKKDQDLLCSLAERIEALERETNQGISIMGQTSTEQA